MFFSTRHVRRIVLSWMHFSFFFLGKRKTFEEAKRSFRRVWHTSGLGWSFNINFLRCLGWSMDSCIWAWVERNWARLCFTTFLTRNPLCNAIEESGMKQVVHNPLICFLWYLQSHSSLKVCWRCYLWTAMEPSLPEVPWLCGCWMLRPLHEDRGSWVEIAKTDSPHQTQQGIWWVLLQMLLHRLLFFGWQEQISVLVGRSPSTFWVLFDFVLMIQWCPTFAACSDLGLCLTRRR